ncbi:hypothetical protein [Cupriavidus pauculus]|uniref:hypothetical protein n=1 Tax=Cupriavidus pauculus TaxID=82633 RepID=UPI001EE1C832|nr:hypothetical protein [Cupriavidus pauculus]GJG96628.1 hypothetical protein CBA19C6_19085 [Cupriavidus pauculus]
MGTWRRACRISGLHRHHGLGAIPLEVLGSGWLRWGGQHERLNGTLRLAAERAEAGGDDRQPIGADATRAVRCDAVAAGGVCVPGDRIALASLPPMPVSLQPDGVLPISHIALWDRP